MAYLLNGVTIKSPNQMDENNSTQFAQQRTLSGAINRDFFGSSKKVWTLNYRNLLKTEFDTINSQYQTYLSSGSPITFQVTETNYTVASTNVHVDLPERVFRVGGSDYISDFSITLTED